MLDRLFGARSSGCHPRRHTGARVVLENLRLGGAANVVHILFPRRAGDGCGIVGNETGGWIRGGAAKSRPSTAEFSPTETSRRFKKPGHRQSAPPTNRAARSRGQSPVNTATLKKLRDFVRPSQRSMTV